MENINKLTNRLSLCRISGQRPDQNKYNNYRTININPQSNEVLTQARANVRPNILKGSFENVEHYIDTHFRLLREDFLAPLRKGICTYKENLKTNDNVKINEFRIYNEARFIRDSEMGETFWSNFNGNRTRVETYKILNPGKCSQKYRVNMKENFMSGSCLCFSSDDFETIFFGIVVKVGGMIKPFVNVQVLEDVPFLYNQTYTMLECTNYYNPYNMVLKVLQNFDTNHFPMVKYIVNVVNKPELPSYLINDPEFIVPNNKRGSSKEALNLNVKQYEAFKHALTTKFSIIQGPPGTGKTYLALKIVQTILSNKSNSGPILVVACSNHALDQFLEGLIPHTENIIRIGYQSKNDNITRFIFRGHSIGGDALEEFYNGIERALDTSRSLMEQLECVLSYNGIFNVKTFAAECPELKNSPLFRWGNDQILAWLLGNFSTEEERQKRWDMTKQISERFQDHSINLKCASTTYKENYIITISGLKQTLAQQKSVDEYYEKIQDTTAYLQWRLQHAEQHGKLYTVKLIQTDDLHKLSYNNRWILYFHWLHCYIQHLKAALKESNSNLYRLWEELNEYRQKVDSYEVLPADIVGMTTSGAAKNRHLLENLKCRIVVVEEAAQMLESHIIVSLTRHCEHLILIGDHQQLRPSTADYQIEQEFHLSISLFERMVRNGISYNSLKEQHRMRPEISRLIVPTIYPNLENHKSVYNFPNIGGIGQNVFFITHTHPEVKISTSRINPHEAEYVVALARHLILQGNDPSDLTILTTYKSQQREITNKQKESLFNPLQKVHVTTVDNFQGEENQIILLSLVRSNTRACIGFLAIENRICVALSRAKKGFYMVGNIDILSQNSKIWFEIKRVLVKYEQIGPGLPLTCQLHPSNVTIAQTPEDFLKVRDGGCYLPCNGDLRCEHLCQKKCHVTDLDHKDYSCMKDCKKILCAKQHRCRKKCWEKCGSCQFPVAKLLPCKHKAMVPCGIDVKQYKCQIEITMQLNCGHIVSKPCFDDTFQCPIEVETIKICGHKVKKQCYEPEAEILCRTIINIALKCGHKIKGECWHKNNYLEASCNERCLKKIKCGHICRKECHYKTTSTTNKCECGQKCTKLKIGCQKNHKCSLKCSDPCEPCHENVALILPCRHSKTVPCRKSNEKYVCEICKRLNSGLSLMYVK